MQDPYRKRNLYSLFAAISAILALGHFVALQFSLTLAKELDDGIPDMPIANWNVKQNVPFAIIIGVFAAAQFCSSMVIFILNFKKGSAKTLYYNALIALLTSFAIGVSLAILASEYNTFTRQFPKNDTKFPTLMPFYFTVQVDATATFLFSFPMLLFIFYYNLQAYLLEEKEVRKQVTELTNAGSTQDKQIFLLVLFLLNSIAHIVFIYMVYQFTGVQNTIDYSLDNLADQYTFYIAVAVAVSLIAIIIQVHHFRRPFLSKNQVILTATLAAIFQFGSFIIMAIKAAQFQIDITLMDDTGICYFNDCNEARTFRWEIIGFSAFTLITLIAQIPYFKIITNMPENDQKRDTLLTLQQGV